MATAAAASMVHVGICSVGLFLNFNLRIDSKTVDTTIIAQTVVVSCFTLSRTLGNLQASRLCVRKS